MADNKHFKLSLLDHYSLGSVSTRSCLTSVFCTDSIPARIIRQCSGTAKTVNDGFGVQENLKASFGLDMVLISYSKVTSVFINYIRTSGRLETSVHLGQPVLSASPALQNPFDPFLHPLLPLSS
jgi:hypothetical protein